MANRTRGKIPRFSQGWQDVRLDRIFRALRLEHGPSRTYVEFGFPQVGGSNTEALRLRGWTGRRFDGQCLGKSAADDAQVGCSREWITSSNIVELFQRHGVDTHVDYVSIDLDTTDLWVLRALLSSEFRPKVLSVEYNSNFPYGYALAFPDTAHEVAHPALRRWDGDCYMGSSASAIEMVAQEFGYVLVDVDPGLDLFLVDGRLWGSRPVPSADSLSVAVYRPFNIRRNHVGLTAAKAAAYLDYATFRQSGGSVAAARRMAATQFARLREAHVPCFVDHQCALSKLVTCYELWSVLCPGNGSGWFRKPCRRFKVGVPIWPRRANSSRMHSFRTWDLNARAAQWEGYQTWE